jgi:hypothetical protein
MLGRFDEDEGDDPRPDKGFCVGSSARTMDSVPRIKPSPIPILIVVLSFPGVTSVL